MQILCTVEGGITSSLPKVCLVGETSHFQKSHLWYDNIKAPVLSLFPIIFPVRVYIPIPAITFISRKDEFKSIRCLVFTQFSEVLQTINRLGSSLATTYKQAYVFYSI